MSVPADERRRQAALGEWAALGVLHVAPAHGWAVARRLRPDGDVGRVWSLSRPLTYRALDTLAERGLIEPVGLEPGTAGPNRTILALTAAGRSTFVEWVTTPVEHLRDVRSELLLKLVLAQLTGIDAGPMLVAQRHVVNRLTGAWSDVDESSHDPVAAWRYESAQAVVRFLDRVAPPRSTTHR